jgi:hypothetical protein
MKTYMAGDLKIETTAEVMAVRVGGHSITPKEKKVGILQSVKHLAKKVWQNNYFRKHSKAHVTVKVAEVGSRLFGAHQLYPLAEHYLAPHLPVIIAFLKTLDTRAVFCIDVGFAIGLTTAFALVHLKRRFFTQ